MASGKAKVFANQDTIQVPKKIDSDDYWHKDKLKYQ